MNAYTAVDLVNLTVTYKPGWTITATVSDRFEDAISVKYTYPAQRSERIYWPEYREEVPGGANASFLMQVDDVKDNVDLYRRLLDQIMQIEEHEAREFLKISPTGWAPFQPHRSDGMRRWGDISGDFSFGLA